MPAKRDLALNGDKFLEPDQKVKKAHRKLAPLLHTCGKKIRRFFPLKNKGLCQNCIPFSILTQKNSHQKIWLKRGGWGREFKLGKVIFFLVTKFCQIMDLNN
jgi:hypothetical protein